MITNTVIPYEGLLLRAMTANEAAKYPDLHGTIHSENIRGTKTGQTIAQLMRRGDQLYYWDGPWGVLAGSAGLALVRKGAVVDTFTTLMS